MKYMTGQKFHNLTYGGSNIRKLRTIQPIQQMIQQRMMKKKNNIDNDSTDYTT